MTTLDEAQHRLDLIITSLDSLLVDLRPEVEGEDVNMLVELDAAFEHLETVGRLMNRSRTSEVEMPEDVTYEKDN